MKRTFLITKKLYLKGILILFLFSPLLVKAQYSNEIVNGTTHQSFLAGSLPTDNTANYAKLQINILGGGWGSNNLGITTFYVGNRGGLIIHQTTNGSGTGNYVIKAYANTNGNTDIYIIVNADYPAFAIKSCMLQGNATQLQTIVQQTPAGTDVTPVIVPVFITDQDGNIGINTAPYSNYKFAINGSGIATAFYVKASGSWPDYVFDPGYQLPSLSSLKTYIDLNQHLPDMPTADDVAKNGINLGETDKLLTKKVEELTLYLIDKEKQLNDQDKIIAKEQSEIDGQQKQIDELKRQITSLVKKRQ